MLSAARALHTGLPLLSEAGGPVTRFVPLSKFLAPALVLVTPPPGVRDVLGRTDGLTECCQIHQDVRNALGHHRPVGPNPFDGQRLSARVAVHHGRQGADPGSHRRAAVKGRLGRIAARA
ncbi:hypothetical protein [Mycobacterium sp.]|uniref:hypothetical protein n=1 Tax=Mycobacterium sp. TaxID=1785 RepID=UPI0031D31E7B